MKNIALVLLLAGIAVAKELPPTEPTNEPDYDDKDADAAATTDADATPADDDAGIEPELTPEEQWKLYWEQFDDHMLMARMGWQGVYQGLYGIAGEADAPKEDCFGEWIPEKMKEVSGFREKMKDDIRSVGFDDAATVAYDIVDLVFMNDKYCHFRKVIWDLHDFCWYGTTCSSDMVFDNMQKNAFNIITQVSSTASIFKQTKWADMDAEHRGYTVNQMGHSLAGLVADLIAFDPENIPLPPPEPEVPAEDATAEGDDAAATDAPAADDATPEVSQN